MNWITSVLTPNQWMVVWLGIGLLIFIALYVWDIWADDPLMHGAGRGNPIPMFIVAGIGTFFLSSLFMGGGYVIDWLVWMWSN